ncbi:pantetheine-phosphate adenylyltransferase [Actinobacillus delphinicola]|uniref:pantetheine-phosphate adenylyltransferase n=1 Tax=Actinobacillus delphinicola TaxID=51161 RepID=UPI0024422903|nr:pantetheine-phosphate adenylyltransferase [Actinobacillus delphinicola]MDG6897905.1 pantetheine-phosphate adenylyltransferase [Actinobacillus delphinicola]
MIKVIYPGTFDPITNGHVDIIARAAKLFSQVMVAVAKNPSKGTLVSFDDRIFLTKEALAHLPNVEVIGFDGLLANLVKEQNITAIVRGVRNSIDFEYERQLADVNAHLANNVETILLTASEKVGYISSTVVREVFLHEGDVGGMVPENVLNYLLSLK